MPKTTSVTWVGKRQFVGTDSHKHSVVLSSHDEENGTGMSPSDLLLVALGGCSSYDVVGILEKKREELIGLEVTITGEQDEDPPWTYRHIHVHYVLEGVDLSEKAVADAVSLSVEKYCSVAATVRGKAELTYDFEIKAAGGE
jgi:putative redox protein